MNDRNFKSLCIFFDECGSYSKTKRECNYIRDNDNCIIYQKWCKCKELKEVIKSSIFCSFCCSKNEISNKFCIYCGIDLSIHSEVEVGESSYIDRVEEQRDIQRKTEMINKIKLKKGRMKSTGTILSY